jgi:transposase
MANTPKNMALVKQILLLHKAEVPKKDIARQLGISRNTVKSYLAKASLCKESIDELTGMDTPVLLSKLLERSGADRMRQEEFKEHAPQYIDELKKHKHLTRYLLWQEEYLAGRTRYKYSQFCEHLRSYESRQNTASVITHIPGEKMYMDFAGDKLYLTDCHSGKLTPCEVLIVTLGYSSYTKVLALPSQRLDDVVEGLVSIFHALGGVSKALVPDNFKSAITRSDRYEPVLNARFLDMANYYGFAVLPARPGKPKDKAKVEGTVNHIYHRIYGRIRNQSFSTIQQLNERLALLCDEFNESKMKGYGMSRRELLERDERSQLLELPIEKYRKVEEYKLKVQTNNHVHISRLSQYYSVPHRLIGQQVTVLMSGKLLKVYHQGHCVATHAVGYGRYQTQSDHMGSSHKAFLDSMNPDFLKNRALNIAPEVHMVISQVLNRSRHPEQNYKTCQGILALYKRFGSAKLIEGCRIALQADIISLNYIRRICENPYSGSLPLADAMGALPLHENIRGNYQ